MDKAIFKKVKGIQKQMKSLNGLMKTDETAGITKSKLILKEIEQLLKQIDEKEEAKLVIQLKRAKETLTLLCEHMAKITEVNKKYEAQK